MIRVAAAVACLTVALVGSARGALTTSLNANLPVTKNSPAGDFISGTGIPSNGFTIGGNDVGSPLQVTVALKARGRDTGQPISLAGNVYTVLAGAAASNPSSPWWVFDYQFSPGPNGLAGDIFGLRLRVDFNPAAGVENFIEIDMQVADGTVDFPPDSWDDTDGYFVNGSPVVFSDPAVDFVVANSWHLGMSFWGLLGAGAFNPNAPGEYKIDLMTYSDGIVIAESAIIVNVITDPAAVPEPGSMAMLVGLAACGIPAALRRRKR